MSIAIPRIDVRKGAPASMQNTKLTKGSRYQNSVGSQKILTKPETTAVGYVLLDVFSLRFSSSRYALRLRNMTGTKKSLLASQIK